MLDQDEAHPPMRGPRDQQTCGGGTFPRALRRPGFQQERKPEGEGGRARPQVGRGLRQSWGWVWDSTYLFLSFKLTGVTWRVSGLDF